MVSDGSLWLLVKRGKLRIKNTQICLKNVLFSLDLKITTVGIISYLSFIVLD